MDNSEGLKRLLIDEAKQDLFDLLEHEEVCNLSHNEIILYHVLLEDAEPVDFRQQEKTT